MRRSFDTQSLCDCKILTTRARLVAERGVVFFRKQNDMTIEQQRELGQHFGPLHVHPTYATPARGDLEDVVGTSFLSHLGRGTALWYEAHSPTCPVLTHSHLQ